MQLNVSIVGMILLQMSDDVIFGSKTDHICINIHFFSALSIQSLNEGFLTKLLFFSFVTSNATAEAQKFYIIFSLRTKALLSITSFALDIHAVSTNLVSTIHHVTSVEHLIFRRMGRRLCGLEGLCEERRPHVEAVGVELGRLGRRRRAAPQGGRRRGSTRGAACA